MLEVDVRKKHGAFTLDLSAATKARVLGVVGPSGSGKTTLLNCIAGTVVPEEGRIAIDGRILFDSQKSACCVPVARRGVGYVFQEGLLFPHLSVEANLRFGEGRHGRAPAFSEIVDVLELGPLLPQRADTLSGGEARRVAVGRALMSAPRILLLDEPLAGLDRHLAAQMLAYLRRVLQSLRVPTIYVSHSVGDVLFLCDEAWRLSEGRLVSRGSARRVLLHAGPAAELELRHLENLFVARCESEGPCARAVFGVGEHRLQVVASGHRPGEEAVLAIYASDIILATARPERISARNILPGRVVDVVPAGELTHITVDVGMEQSTRTPALQWIAQLTPSAVEELDLAPGAAVFAVVKASAVSVAGPASQT